MVTKYTTLDAFLNDLTPAQSQIVDAIRKLILSLNTDLNEEIKWNAPSYIYKGEHRITFNMHYEDRVTLVLHMGATRKEDKKATPIMNDASGLIEWISDIRGTLSFKSIEDFESKKESTADVLTNWLAIPA